MTDAHVSILRFRPAPTRSSVTTSNNPHSRATAQTFTRLREITKGAVARDKIREDLMPAQVLEGQKRASELLRQLIEPKDDLAKSQTANAPLPYRRN